MSYKLCLILFTTISVTVITGACSPPTTSTPSPIPEVTEEQLPYTAAAATISSQLTDIAVANTTGITITADEQVISATATTSSEDTATLPSTSTPLPSQTPVPADTTLPTDTPEASPTIQQTQTMAPTKVGEDPVNNLGSPDWTDTFNNANNWPLYNDEHVEMKITEGNRLKMTSLNADIWESWMLTHPVLENFYVEVKATPGECSGLDRYGMIVRATLDAKKGYFYGLTCDGSYSLRIWDGDTFSMITPWISHDDINKGEGETNTFGLYVEGDQLTLYANGVKLTTLKDTTFTEGLLGLFIGGLNTEGFNVWFEEISYWELPPSNE